MDLYEPLLMPTDTLQKSPRHFEPLPQRALEGLQTLAGEEKSFATRADTLHLLLH